MALVSTFTAESCLGFTDMAGVVNHVALSSRPPPQRVDVRQGRLRRECHLGAEANGHPSSFQPSVMAVLGS